MLIGHQMELLDHSQGGIQSLFDQNNFETLKLLYDLYSPVKDGLKPIGERFKNQLIKMGTKLIRETETSANGKDLPIKVIISNSQLVENVIEMLLHYRRMIDECFSKDNSFERQLMLSFQDFMNLDVGKFSMAEILATYSDKVLRKGGIKGERKLIDEQLDSIALLFAYLFDKDLFLLVYRNHLARRLLQESYEDFELERHVVTRLKLVCGMQQMNQMQGMLADYVTVKEESKEFTNFESQGGAESQAQDGNFEFTIQCLKTANWPAFKEYSIAMPR